MDINPQITPSLHPDMVKTIKGYNAVSSPNLPIHQLLVTTYRVLGSVYTFRDAAKRNPGWTYARQVVETANFTDKKKAFLVPKFEKLHKELANKVSELETALSAPLEISEDGGAIRGEIRAYYKSISDSGERGKQLRAAIKKNDTLTATAVLAAPAYLSGMTDEERVGHLKLYRSYAHPTKDTEIVHKSSAANFVKRSGVIVESECRKAIGEKPQQVESFRRQMEDHAT